MSDSNEMNTKGSHPKLMPPVSRDIAEKGIQSMSNLFDFVNAAIADNTSERMPSDRVVNNIKLLNVMLKAAELQYRYAKEQEEMKDAPRLLTGK